MGLDGWVVPPDNPGTRRRGRSPHERTEAMPQRIPDLVERFCQYQQKQHGKAEGGVKTYRWVLEQLLRFVRARDGRLARVEDLNTETLQAWIDDMAASNLSINTLRSR